MGLTEVVDASRLRTRDLLRFGQKYSPMVYSAHCQLVGEVHRVRPDVLSAATVPPPRGRTQLKLPPENPGRFTSIPGCWPSENQLTGSNVSPSVSWSREHQAGSCGCHLRWRGSPPAGHKALSVHRPYDDAVLLGKRWERKQISHEALACERKSTRATSGSYHCSIGLSVRFVPFREVTTSYSSSSLSLSS